MDLRILKQQIAIAVEASEDEGLLQDVANLLNRYPSTVEDRELTQLCMLASEKSLAEEWDKEENAHWESFLKD